MALCADRHVAADLGEHRPGGLRFDLYKPVSRARQRSCPRARSKRARGEWRSVVLVSVAGIDAFLDGHEQAVFLRGQPGAVPC